MKTLDVKEAEPEINATQPARVSGILFKEKDYRFSRENIDKLFIRFILAAAITLELGQAKP